MQSPFQRFYVGWLLDCATASLCTQSSDFDDQTHQYVPCAKAHIVPLHACRLVEACSAPITQLRSTSQATTRMRLVVHLSFRFSHDERRQWAAERIANGAERLRFADGDLLVRQDAGRASDDDPALDGRG